MLRRQPAHCITVLMPLEIFNVGLVAILWLGMTTNTLSAPKR